MPTKIESTDPNEPIDTSDPSVAPFIYFEAAPCFGTIPGMVRITLSASRVLTKAGSVIQDDIAVAHLRCNVIAARALKDSLEKALLMAEQSPPKAN